MTRIKTLLSTVITTGFLFASLPAGAQQSGGMGQGMGMGHGMGMGQKRGSGMMGPMMQGGMMGRDCPMMGMMMGGRRHGFQAGRIAFLKAELQITDAQKSVFDAYAAAIRANLKNMHTMHKGMSEKRSAKTPVERLNLHVSMMESRLTSLQTVKPALEALYAALSDEQKQKAGQLMTGMGCMM